MSVFVDTGLYYARHDEDAVRHRSATRAFRRVLTGEFGHLYTSDYVIDEAITLMLDRSESMADALSLGHRIIGQGGFEATATILHVSKRDFDAAFRDFERYGENELSFTDATIIALMENRDIDHLLSFDSDFDGLVDRLDPRSF